MTTPGLAFGGVMASLVAMIAGGVLGGSTGIVFFLSGLAAFIISLSQLHYSTIEPPPSPPKPLANELEALLAIERRLAAVEEHSSKTRGYAGCLLSLIAILAILSALGFFATRSP